MIREELKNAHFRDLCILYNFPIDTIMISFPVFIYGQNLGQMRKIGFVYDVGNIVVFSFIPHIIQIQIIRLQLSYE